MDTVEYSEHLVRIGKNLMRISENVEAAADNDIDGFERDEAINKARAKLIEYENVVALLTVDSKVLEAQFVNKFKQHIDLIRESLECIDSK